MSELYEPFDLAGLQLKNRVVMAPMTRSRALDNDPDGDTVTYYRQRASSGLIITEGVPISEEGRGYLYTPGIYTEMQIARWRAVTDAVHADGGHIFAQLWHVGRLSHTSLQPQGGAPVSSSAKRADGVNVYAYDAAGNPGQVQASAPRALGTDEVARVTEDFTRAALNAINAGFDGIELHAANAYIFDQFINAGFNDRTDQYGGSIINRLRFLLETVESVSAAIGSKRVGVRIAPFGRLYGIGAFDGELETWTTLAEKLSDRNIAYLHLSDQSTIGGDGIPRNVSEVIRRAYRGTLMSAGGHDKQSAERAIALGHLDMVAFGRPFISNPDLVERLANNWPMTPQNRDTYYSGGHNGYTDYTPYSGS
jgi:2,4-dienoyl-CoA reductase-like NADH-dependent reductase (Old Yellow Enzyme family)